MKNKRVGKNISEKYEIANENLNSIFKNHPFILIDRFASSMRNIYTGKCKVDALKPAVAISYYSPWGSTGPERSFSYEEEISERDRKAKHNYIVPVWQKALPYIQTLKVSPIISTWYETRLLKFLAKSCKGKLIAVPEYIKNRLENKCYFNNILLQAGISQSAMIESMNIRNLQQMPSYQVLKLKFGSPFVIQSNSSGGNGTIFVKEENDMNKATEMNGPFRIARYIRGFSSNVTILTIPNQHGGCEVYVDLPSHKGICIDEVGIGPAKGAGNDWSIPFSIPALIKFIDFSVRIGEYIFEEYGLVGLWGLDSIWNGDDFVFNELNCRNQGTTEVSCVNQIMRGCVPFLVAHIATHLGIEISWMEDSTSYNQGTLSLTDTCKPFYLKIRNKRDTPLRTKPGFNGSGIYRFTDQDDLLWLRSNSNTLDANLNLQEILIANAPNPLITCSTGSELCTLEGITSKPIFKGPHNLSKIGSRMADAIYKQFIEFSPSKKG